MFQKLESGAYALLVVQMSVADAEESSWAEHHCSWSFGAEAALGETHRDHFLLDVVALFLGQGCARKAKSHAWQPHRPQCRASFVSAERCFGHACRESVTLGAQF
jgi:hypothetical protein